jgi:hypothetical protein
MAKKLKGTPYIADPSYVLPRKSTGPAATCHGPKRAALKMTPSQPKVKK